MRKSLIFTYVIFLSVLCSCLPFYKITNYFPAKTLRRCLVSDLIEPINAINMDAPDNHTITYTTDLDSFNEYVIDIYEYLKGKDVVLGIQGEVLSSLFGAMPNYAFYKSESLEEHIKLDYSHQKIENSYLFVYGYIDDTNNIIDNFVELHLLYLEGNVTMSFRYSKNSLCSYRFMENRAYYLYNLIPWLNDRGNALNIKKEYVNEDYKATYLYNDYDAIDNFHSEHLVREYTGEIENYYRVNYIYEMNDGTTYEISIVDGYLLYNGVYYTDEEYNFHDIKWKKSKLISATILRETEYDVINKETNEIINDFSIKDISFDQNFSNEDFDTLPANEMFYIPELEIYIYTEKFFEYNYILYKITSEKDFSELFKNFEQ